MFNPETNSQYEILVAQESLKLPYDEELTEATLVLAAMRRHDVRAFDAALKFPFISEEMTYIERYNKIYAYCKGWIHKRPVHHQAESDWYASSEAWQALWDSTKRRAATVTRNLDSESCGATPHQVSLRPLYKAIETRLVLGWTNYTSRN